MELDDPDDGGDDTGAVSDGASVCLVSVASEGGVTPPVLVTLPTVVVVVALLLALVLVVDLDVDG